MNNKTLFNKAHKMAKSIIREGDNYQVTFAACLKFIRSEEVKVTKPQFKEVFSFSHTLAMVFLFVVLAGTICLLVTGTTGNVVMGGVIGSLIAGGTVFHNGTKSAFYTYKYVKPQTRFVF